MKEFLIDAVTLVLLSIADIICTISQVQLTIGYPRCGPCSGAGTPRRGRTGQPPPPRSTGARPSGEPTGSASNPSLGNRNCSSVKDTTREYTLP